MPYMHHEHRKKGELSPVTRTPVVRDNAKNYQISRAKELGRRAGWPAC